VSPLHAFEIGVVLGAAVVVIAIYFRHRPAKKAVSVLSEMP
jgi:multisubunit Na+/H+ antiporter MnhB subunit